MVEGQLILDRYRPLRELGSGGFASVVLAWDTRMQRRIAIKRLLFPLDNAGRPHQPPGLAEARTSAMLSHPCIVTALDFDTDSDEAFIVMEYVDGASLAEVMAEAEGPLTLDETAAVVECVAGALEYAHENGVLHLDIKPENVLITRDGRVKVTDFGVSALSTLTGHGSGYGGTPGYMPIEQLEGRDVSERTDEWAFAAMTFEALAGVNPFVEATSDAAVFRLEAYDPPVIAQYLPDFPAELREVLAIALGGRPSDRYGSVGEFADAITPWLGDAAAGRESLAELVSAFAAEDEEEHPRHGEAYVGLWDRLGGRLGSALLRLAGAVESGWLAWVGLTPFALERPALIAAVSLVAVAAALAPSLGIGLGMGCLIAGMAGSGHVYIALALGISAAGWWWFLAREDSGAAVLPLAGPAFGAARIGFVQPLLAGFALPPGSAAATAALGGALTFLASAATLHGVPYTTVSPGIVTDPWSMGVVNASLIRLLTSPATYVAWAGWPVAAAVMSLLCSRANRAAAALGTLGGIAALTGSYLLAEQVSLAVGRPSTEVWAGAPLAWSLGGSLILMSVIVALGAPMRPEGDVPVEHTALEDEDLA